MQHEGVDSLDQERPRRLRITALQSLVKCICRVRRRKG